MLEVYDGACQIIITIYNSVNNIQNVKNDRAVIATALSFYNLKSNTMKTQCK